MQITLESAERAEELVRRQISWTTSLQRKNRFTEIFSDLLGKN